MATGPYPITIVGCGPGAANCLTGEALRAVEAADVLIGANRLLALFPDSRAEKIPVRADIEAALDAVAARYRTRRVAVLVTGDPGLCSLATPLLRRFGRKCCQVIPGISSVQVAFARVGVDWYGARILSLHGRKLEVDPASLADGEKLALLLEGAASLAVVDELAAHLPEHALFVCEDLTLPGEKVREVSREELLCLEVVSRTVILLIKGTCLE